MPGLYRFYVPLPVLLLLATSSHAAPPAVTTITPRGAERGKSVEITVAGANLTPQTKLILPFKAAQEMVPEPKPNPAQAKIKLTVDPAVPIGIYPARVMTEDGVSAIFLFGVDPFPGVGEVEDNNSFDKAQKIEIPVLVTGQIAGNDVDHYRFSAKKGQRLVIEVEAARLGSGVDPYFRIMDGDRRFIGSSSDTPGLKRDCRFIFMVPADGEYVVEVQDTAYRANPPPHYRLKIGEYEVIEEVFPLGGRRGESAEFTLRGGTLQTEARLQQPLAEPFAPFGLRSVDLLRLEQAVKPGPLAPTVAVGDLPERLWIKGSSKDPRQLDVVPPMTINSRLERQGDTDRFQFPVRAGQRFRIAVEAERLGSLLDGVLRVTDQAGKQIALVDDVALAPLAPGLQATRLADPAVDITVPADASMLIVELRDQRQRGGLNYVYRMSIEPVGPDFALQQPLSEVNIPRGGAAAISVPVVRTGYAGPIRLTITNLPAGLSVQGGMVPENRSWGVLLLSAAADVQQPPEPFSLTIQGQATIEGQEVRRSAEQKLVLARDGNVASSVLTLSSFAAAVTSQEPFAVKSPSSALEVVKGYSANLPVEVVRAKGQEMLALQVTGVLPISPPLPAPGQAAPPPQALPAVKEGALAASMANGTVVLNAATNATEGVFDLVVQGKAKVNNADRTVTGSLVTLTVARPFTVELLTPTMELAAGKVVSLKGRIHRKDVFKEPVQFKVDGLPAGVTIAAMKPLAGDWNEFQIDLNIDAKAAAATANLTLTASTMINGQAYAHPAVTVSGKVAPASK